MKQKCTCLAYELLLHKCGNNSKTNINAKLEKNINMEKDIQVQLMTFSYIL